MKRKKRNQKPQPRVKVPQENCPPQTQIQKRTVKMREIKKLKGWNI